MSDLQVGLEVEWPIMGHNDELYVDRGRQSRELQSEVPNDPSVRNCRNDWDGTVGLELVTEPPLPLEDIPNWYRDTLDYVRSNHGAEYQPCGLLEGGSTAGLHVHLSPITTSEARSLFEMSQTAWMKVLFCTSIAKDGESLTWPVFRGGQYCAMEIGSGPGRTHYNCLNQRGPEHWEWRLPEPMTAENVDVLVEFLRAFKQSPEAAQEYAQGILDDADDRITSIRRAESVGMDIDAVPSVRRAQPDCDPEGFYEEVEDTWEYPEIYLVQYEEQPYYMFESRLPGTFQVHGVEFSADSVLYADTLEQVTDDELRHELRRVYDHHGSDGIRQTEATEELKKIVKKKQ